MSKNKSKSKVTATTNAGRIGKDTIEPIALVQGHFRNLQGAVSKLPESPQKKEILQQLNEAFMWASRGFFELAGKVMEPISGGTHANA